jgi:2-(1,2-epoxy-1,2-dihydrophenyl)acetyl-CoA isomerase
MELVTFEVIDSIAKITLNRPDKYNAVNKEIATNLQLDLDECATNKDIRAVYLTGTGKAFCAGQDLQEVVEDNEIDLPHIVEKHYNPIIMKIREIEKPVVCAVNGVAAGAGANIALACDIVVAKKSAKFIQAFSKIGLIPDSGGTYTLPRLIGIQRATALMMLGEPVSADDAVDMGMIYKAYPDDEFEEKAWELTKKLAGMPTKGLGLTKRALLSSYRNDLDKQLAIECELQSAAGQTYDYEEGVSAFLEKREPKFKGH